MLGGVWQLPLTHPRIPGHQPVEISAFAVYGTGHLDESSMDEAVTGWRNRLEHLFDDAPIAFRPQNGGDYTNHHELANHIAPNKTGLMAHIADAC